MCFSGIKLRYVYLKRIDQTRRRDFSRDSITYSRVKNYSQQDVSLKRVIVRYDAPARERFAPRRTVMITRMHILRNIGCRRNCT